MSSPSDLLNNELASQGKKYSKDCRNLVIYSHGLTVKSAIGNALRDHLKTIDGI